LSFPAVIAAACATEVFKIATNCYEMLNNYMVFNDVDGIYTYKFEAMKKSDCLACSSIPKTISISNPSSMTLQDLIDLLCNDADFQLKNPALTTNIDGSNKTLYMSAVKSIEEQTRPNLTQSLHELNLVDGQELMVADATNPNTIVVKLKFIGNEVEMY
jgi:NEDD8-activating enzyme E1